MLEACVDIPHQVWEPRVLMFEQTAEHVADAIAEELAGEPGCDARLTGCNRRTLQPDPDMGSWLFYLAEEALSASLAEPPGSERSW